MSAVGELKSVVAGASIGAALVASSADNETS